MGRKFLRANVFFTALCCLFLMMSGCSNKTARNISVSKPLLSYSVEEHSLYSTILEREIPYILYVPKGYGDGKEYPVWYALHGSGSNQTQWPDSGIITLSDALTSNNEINPLIMVFPFVQDASAKEIREDLKDGKIDERKNDIFITKELIPFIDAHYFTQKKRESRFIGGFSMGGMLALRIGFHHPDLFSKIGAYSPAVPSQDYSNTQLEKWLNPNEKTSGIKDVIQYAKKKGYRKLQVYLDTGNNNDPFRTGVESFHEALLKRGISSSFVLYNGGHSLQKNYFEDYLKFYTGK